MEKKRGENQMKALKTLMVVLIAVAFILPIAVTEAHAAAAYVVCWVNYTGLNAAGQRLIQLTDTNTTTPVWPGKRYFVLTNIGTSETNSMLSTALTAMASGMKVNVHLADTVAGANCDGIVLLDQ
jgi:hypothetical protein